MTAGIRWLSLHALSDEELDMDRHHQAQPQVPAVTSVPKAVVVSAAKLETNDPAVPAAVSRAFSHAQEQRQLGARSRTVGIDEPSATRIKQHATFCEGQHQWRVREAPRDHSLSGVPVEAWR